MVCLQRFGDGCIQVNERSAEYNMMTNELKDKLEYVYVLHAHERLSILYSVLMPIYSNLKYYHRLIVTVYLKKLAANELFR